MGWDYYTYIDQPFWFLQDVMDFLKKEADDQKRALQKLNKR